MLKVNVNAATLKNAASFVKGSVAGFSPVASYLGIKFSTENGELVLSAYNGSSFAKRTIPYASVIEEGNAVVSGKLLMGILSTADPISMVDLEETKSTLRIKSEWKSYNLPLVGSDEIPSQPEFKGALNFEIPKDTFDSVVGGILPCVGKEKPGTNPATYGISLVGGDHPILSATTGACYAERTLPIALPPIDAVTSASIWNRMSKLKEGKTVSITIDDTHIEMSVKDKNGISTLVEPRFHAKAFRAGFVDSLNPTISASMNKEVLMGVLRDASVFQGAKVMPIRFEFDQKESCVKASLLSEMGHYKAEIPITDSYVRGNESDVFGFDPNLLRGIVAEVPEDEHGNVTMELTNPISPMVFHKEGFVDVILPFRLNA